RGCRTTAYPCGGVVKGDGLDIRGSGWVMASLEDACMVRVGTGAAVRRRGDRGQDGHPRRGDFPGAARRGRRLAGRARPGLPGGVRGRADAEAVGPRPALLPQWLERVRPEIGRAHV